MTHWTYDGIRSAFEGAHPDMELVQYWEPHKRFLEKLQRAVTVHGRIFYRELAEVRLASEEILSKPSFTPTADQLAISGEEDAMNRLNALLIAYKLLGLMGYSRSRQIEGVWPGSGSTAATTPTHEASGPSDRKKRVRPTRGEKNRAQKARIEALEDTRKQRQFTSRPALRDNKNSTARVPDAEWKAMSNLGPTGWRCKFWNSSCGCHQPNCGFELKCLECGGDHRWVDRHSGK